MEEVEGHHRQDNRRAIKHVEVDLVSDNVPCPSIHKLYGSVNGTDEDPNCCNPRAEDHQTDLGWEGTKGLL